VGLNEHLEHPEGDVVFRNVASWAPRASSRRDLVLVTDQAVARLAQVKNPEASAIKREAEESGVSDELGTRIGRSVLEKRLGTRRRRHEGSPGSASISDW
jgi:hypothetical protein